MHLPRWSNKSTFQQLGLGGIKKDGMTRNWEVKDRFEGMRRALVWSAQAAIFAASGVAAFFLRFDLRLPPAYLRHLAYAIPIWILVKIVVFHVAKLDRGLWRYLYVGDLY